ncbi:natural cytotoxicity triggering receptor 3 ligand 1-like isoform X3 [Hyperolius riggenbachi]
MGPSPVYALRGQDVTISCNIANMDNSKAIAVEWKNNQNNVYVYNNGGVTLHRDGSYMDVEEILKGNAELHLPNVQISDDGEYTCKVINTPRDASGKTALQVLVQPSVTVTPRNVTIELGMNQPLTCEVTNFYPQPKSIHWVRYNKDSSGYEVLKNGICTAKPNTNSDGTFNVTSHLVLSPDEADAGSLYGCVFTPMSIHHAITRNFTVIVTAAKKKYDRGTIIGTGIVSAVISTLLAVICVMIYMRMLKKEPPTLSAITGNDKLMVTDMSRTTLTCHIMNYRPNDITVSVCLRRRGQQQEVTIYTWRSRDSTAPVRLTRDGDHVSLDVKEQHMLVSGAARQNERPLQLEVVPVVSRSKCRSFSCQCSLHITPRYDLDNGAELSIDVTHPTLTSPISVRRVLYVVGGDKSQ